MRKNLFNSLTLTACLSSFMAIETVQAQATLIADSFDDDDITTNTNGIGSGFVTGFHNDSTATVTEAEGLITVTSGANGAARQQIASVETFNANDSTPIETTFSLEDFGRNASIDSETTRHFLGLVSSTDTGGNGIQNSGPFQNQVDGLWVGLQVREDSGDLTGVDNGQGTLVYANGTTNTVLATWTWNQDLVMWDEASTFRSDRISMDLLSPIELTLTSDATGYSLSFTTSGTGTLPDNISGTWADAGVTNDLDTVHAVAYSQANSGDLVLSSIRVEGASAGNYAAWASGFPDLTNTSPDFDFDSDGLDNGVEWVVGGNPTMSDTPSLAPIPDTSDPSTFQITYRRTDEANNDPNTTIFVEYSSSLNPDSWITAEDGIDAISISSEDDFFGAGIDRVTVSIPRTLAPNAKLFARLVAEISNP